MFKVHTNRLFKADQTPLRSQFFWAAVIYDGNGYWTSTEMRVAIVPILTRHTRCAAHVLCILQSLVGGMLDGVSHGKLWLIL